MTQSAYKAPSPEDVEVGKAYAFTLSPIDNLQFFNANIIHRVNQFKNGTKEVLDSLFNPTDIRVKLRMELSKQSRLHYHGWITFSSDEDIYFYLIMIRKLKKSLLTIFIQFLITRKMEKDLVINILLGRLM